MTPTSKVDEFLKEQGILHTDPVEDFLAHYGTKGMKWRQTKKPDPKGVEKRPLNSSEKDFLNKWQTAKDVLKKYGHLQISKLPYQDQVVISMKLAKEYTLKKGGTKQAAQAAATKILADSLRSKAAPRIIKTPIRHTDDFEVDGIIEHHGVPGMKWGVRRASGSSSGGGGRTPGKKKAATGSVTPSKRTKVVSGPDGTPRINMTAAKAGPRKYRPKKAEIRLAKTASDDAWNAHLVNKQIQRGGVKSLSNAQIKVLNDRLNLEKNLGKMTPKRKSRLAKMGDLMVAAQKGWTSPQGEAARALILPILAYKMQGKTSKAAKFAYAAARAGTPKKKGQKAKAKPDAPRTVEELGLLPRFPNP